MRFYVYNIIVQGVRMGSACQRSHLLPPAQKTFGVGGFTTADDAGSFLQTPHLSSCPKSVTLWLCLLQMERSLCDAEESRSAV